MNPATFALLLQFISLASKLVPEVLSEINGIKAQTGKTEDEIFAEAGLTWDANIAKALGILAKLDAKNTP